MAGSNIMHSFTKMDSSYESSINLWLCGSRVVSMEITQRFSRIDSDGGGSLCGGPISKLTFLLVEESNSAVEGDA